MYFGYLNCNYFWGEGELFVKTIHFGPMRRFEADERNPDPEFAENYLIFADLFLNYFLKHNKHFNISHEMTLVVHCDSAVLLHSNCALFKL